MARILDSMMLDGLEDVYTPGKAMGAFAEDSAKDYGFTRAEQDAYAIESLARANAAIATGAFEAEIAPVTVKTKAGDAAVAIDEQPGKARPDKIPSLKPAFAKDGAITAAKLRLHLGRRRGPGPDKAQRRRGGRASPSRPASSRRRRTPMSPRFSPPRPPRPSPKPWRKRAGPSPAWTCSKSTRPSPSCR